MAGHSETFAEAMILPLKHRIHVSFPMGIARHKSAVSAKSIKWKPMMRQSLKITPKMEFQIVPVHGRKLEAMPVPLAKIPSEFFLGSFPHWVTQILAIPLFPFPDLQRNALSVYAGKTAYRLHNMYR